MEGGTPTGVEPITVGDTLIAIIVSASASVGATTFLTDDDEAFQLGLLRFPQAGSVPRHVHNCLERSVTGTAELLVVRRGRCEVDLHDEQRRLVATRRLGPGDTVLFLRGGHGLRMLDEVELLEVKQGPYFGDVDKQRF